MEMENEINTISSYRGGVFEIVKDEKGNDQVIWLKDKNGRYINDLVNEDLLKTN